ncbi:hypothetical protein [Geodermatophilus sp. FMUSA9-8]|uniref:hypothetical protein n=1 Tax=Geodermatophilus sp. FMUSA9-8 TaxID=3120155 RepID=UPI0030091652
MQVFWPQAGFSLAHGLTLWFLLGLVAADVRGAQAWQAFCLCCTCLALAVPIFFFAWSVSDQNIVGKFYPPLILAWVLVSPVASGLLVSLRLGAASTVPYLSGTAFGIIFAFPLMDVYRTKGSVDLSAPGGLDLLVVIATISSIGTLVFAIKKLRSQRNFGVYLACFLLGATIGMLMGYAEDVFYAVLTQVY